MELASIPFGIRVDDPATMKHERDRRSPMEIGRDQLRVAKGLYMVPCKGRRFVWRAVKSQFANADRRPISWVFGGKQFWLECHVSG